MNTSTLAHACTALLLVITVSLAGCSSGGGGSKSFVEDGASGAPDGGDGGVDGGGGGDGAVPVSGSTKTTSTAVGKAADVSVGEDGSVGGSVSVNGQGSASTVIDGTVDGNVSLTSTATNNAYDYASTPTGYTNSDTNDGAGGAATGAGGANGTVDGNFTAIGANSVVLNNAGTSKGHDTGTSNRHLKKTRLNTHHSC